MLYRINHAVMLVVLAVAPGCGGNREGGFARDKLAPGLPRAVREPDAPGPTVTNYPIKGVVKKVEKELEHVTLQHEAIPGFMDAMRMRFAYKDKRALATLRPGDQVVGTLRVERYSGVVHDYALLGLKVTEPAPPQPLADSSKKQVPRFEAKRLLDVGDPVPDFTMTSQDSSAVRLSDLRGNVVVLTFIYTRCPLPDFCPLMDKKFSELAERIGAFPERARQIRLVSLSFDPEHDTPDVLRKHAQIRGTTPPLWSYAVASHDELAKIGVPLGLFYQPGETEIAHNLSTAIIDRQGKLARLEIGKERNKWGTADLLKTIYSLLPAARN